MVSPFDVYSYVFSVERIVVGLHCIDRYTPQLLQDTLSQQLLWVETSYMLVA